MEIVIRDCQHCGAMLLEDTGVCPSCGKTLKSNAGAAAVHPVANGTRLEERECPRCGVGVPVGVVRCRDCGEMLGATGGRMISHQAAQSGTAAEYETDQAAAASYTDEGDFETSAAMFSDVSAEDDDFEVAAGVTEDYAVGGDAAGYDSVGYDQAASEYELNAPVAEQYEEYPTGPAAGAEGFQDYSAAEQPPEGAGENETAAQSGETPAEETVDHSVATAGDALLRQAMQEEKEAASRGGRRRRKGSQAEGAFVVYCPQGCRILVQEKHRGRSGKCPKCKSPFFVPLPRPEAEPTDSVTEEGATPAVENKYTLQIEDVRLHRLNPTKLKLKADSLLNEYETADLLASAEHVLLVTVFAGSGPFRAMQEPKKKAAVRQEVHTHLAGGLPVSGLPAPKCVELTSDLLGAIKIAQPTVPGDESLFADIPVFGANRIALRVPAADTQNERGYVSMGLSQFRELAKHVSTAMQLPALSETAAACGIPLEDELSEFTCHYSESKLAALAGVPWYEADPALKAQLKTLGWKCEGCGLVVSEDSRLKEKIGGKAESSVPKARCPKCKKPMGNNRLVGFKPKA